MTVKTNADRMQINHELGKLRELAKKGEAAVIIKGVTVKYLGWGCKGDPKYVVKGHAFNNAKDVINCVQKYKEE